MGIDALAIVIKKFLCNVGLNVLVDNNHKCIEKSDLILKNKQITKQHS
jgi:hypothetical protein